MPRPTAPALRRAECRSAAASLAGCRLAYETEGGRFFPAGVLADFSEEAGELRHPINGDELERP